MQEISLQNGSVIDCNGCPYQTCRHFGETCSCFYGGVIVEEVYPAILDCDGLIVLCPNYNDAVSANLSAFINRLTALFSQVRFYDKAVFCLVVSGYSGGDIVAKQILGALNMNKTFCCLPDLRCWLPPTTRSALTALRKLTKGPRNSPRICWRSCERSQRHDSSDCSGGAKWRDWVSRANSPGGCRKICATFRR